jgi:hypothetical protein
MAVIEKVPADWYKFNVVITEKSVERYELYAHIKRGTDGSPRNLNRLERHLQEQGIEALIVPLVTINKSFINEFRVVAIGSYKGVDICDLTEGHNLTFNSGGSPSSWGRHYKVQFNDVLDVIETSLEGYTEGWSLHQEKEKALINRAYQWY